MKGLNLSGAAEQAGSDLLNERGFGIKGIPPASKSKNDHATTDGFGFKGPHREVRNHYVIDREDLELGYQRI